MDWIQEFFMHIKGNHSIGIIIFIVLAALATIGATKLAEKGSNLFLIILGIAAIYILYQFGFLDVILSSLNF